MRDNIRTQIIQVLANNGDMFISGQELSNRLHVSRTAIWKHMKELEKDGYIFEALPRKGYRLISKPSSMNETSLKWDLGTNWLGHELVYKEIVTSTQDIAHELAHNGAANGTVVIANEQTKGRGRMQRTWHSQPDDGIWMSVILRPDIPPHQASQLTLFTAISIVETLQQFFDLPFKIKWPNDIFVEDKKIAGILTEMKGELDTIDYMIVGIGINVNQSMNDFSEELQQKASSLAIESNKHTDRLPLVQQLLRCFETSYDTYQQRGFALIKEKWLNYAYKLGESVQIKMPNKEFQGRICGISDDGALLVQYIGEDIKIYSAEILW